VVPVLVTGGGAPRLDMGLALSGMVAPVQVADPDSLGAALVEIMQRIGAPARALDFAAWAGAAYRPVPTIIEAARMLYARHGVADIRTARAGPRNLTETTSAIIAAIRTARQDAAKLVLFVTGIPGAGKTLCGLNAVFADDAVRGTFLTGNPSLVHVLREALARDAIAHGGHAGLARRRMAGVIQALPSFRNHYMEHKAECPAETVIVIDEAQRCWSRAHAIRKTRDKAVPLTASEPACLLDIAARHSGFAAILCLVGTGQEIHDGEGGLAEWGEALRARPDWRVMAPPDGVGGMARRHCLGALDGLMAAPLLHLDVPVRQVRGENAAAWVDAVLRNDAVLASRIAGCEDGVPFYLVRDLAALRAGLRVLARGGRRAGLLASAGAKRLRAEGLGAELPHMEPAAVAHWFLDRFPKDIRASDALEQVATEFSCQGLELDYAGLCWDADLVRSPDGWRARHFVGTSWQILRQEEAIANQVNTYRVLLTRARYDTLIFVPYGDAGDRTRDPALYEGIAAFLRQCGVRGWQAPPHRPALGGINVADTAELALL
jgi:hypothetical protein